ncbi:hypothetical protein PJN11_29320, partial [Mycobacterium kansasii]
NGSGGDNNGIPIDELFGAIECGIYDCHLETNHSNNIMMDGVVNAKVINNTLISPFHEGIKAYIRVRGCEIKNNTFTYDDT